MGSTGISFRYIEVFCGDFFHYPAWTPPLSIVGGALREYLQVHNELPKASLVCGEQ
jgi:hypothetical protein